MTQENAISSLPRLTGIICTYERYQVLGGAIESLLSQRVEPGFLEIIIIDNSPDQAAAAAFGAQYRHLAQLRYVLEPAAGLSNARNIGLALAAAPIAGFIDDDARAAPDWAGGIVSAFTEFGPRAGAAGGPVRARWPGARPGWLGDALLNYLGVIDWGGRCREVSPSHGLVGCNMALDRQLALNLGGFSTKLGRMGAQATLLSNEEPDLFARMQAAGRSIIYTPDAVVEHLIGPERLSQTWFRRRAAWQAVSDHLMNPARMGRAAKDAAEHLRWAASKPNRRRPLGFFGEAGNAADFTADFYLMYYATLANLAGGAEIPEMPAQDGAVPPPEGWPVRLKMRHRDLVARLPAYGRFATAVRPLWRALVELVGARGQ